MNGKEPKINKNDGFNLPKTNVPENNSGKLFTAKGALDLLNDVTGRISTAISDCKNILRREMLNIKTELLALINGNTSKLENLERNKEPSILKNTGFNKNFGATNDTVLEGIKLAEILGLTYMGSLNNTEEKILGNAYYDETTKNIYKCIENTRLSYADAEFFIEISNNNLANKIENIPPIIEEYSGENYKLVMYKYTNGTLKYIGTIQNSLKVEIELPLSPITSKPVSASCDGWDSNKGEIVYGAKNKCIVTSSSSGSYVGFSIDGFWK